ncbi:MAG: GAF domain-containing protein [Deltaproteobacteria bacterium]|nr:MAG: GAF domain-containing protein [Deltaproteobacteria bacterium]
MNVGEEEERLANLYIASYNLHASLELGEVVSVILEICINLVGADRTVFYVHDEEREQLVPVAGQGDAALPEATVALGEGPVGQAALAGAIRLQATEVPAAVVPFVVDGRLVGVLSVETLLPQKGAFSPLDAEIFELLGRQGAAALYGAFLAGTRPKKITAEEFRTRLRSQGR